MDNLIRVGDGFVRSNDPNREFRFISGFLDTIATRLKIPTSTISGIIIDGEVDVDFDIYGMKPLCFKQKEHTTLKVKDGVVYNVDIATGEVGVFSIVTKDEDHHLIATLYTKTYSTPLLRANKKLFEQLEKALLSSYVSVIPEDNDTGMIHLKFHTVQTKENRAVHVFRPIVDAVNELLNRSIVKSKLPRTPMVTSAIMLYRVPINLQFGFDTIYLSITPIFKLDDDKKGVMDDASIRAALKLETEKGEDILGDTRMTPVLIGYLAHAIANCDINSVYLNGCVNYDNTLWYDIRGIAGITFTESEKELFLTAKDIYNKWKYLGDFTLNITNDSDVMFTIESVLRFTTLSDKVKSDLKNDLNAAEDILFALRDRKKGVVYNISEYMDSYMILNYVSDYDLCVLDGTKSKTLLPSKDVKRHIEAEKKVNEYRLEMYDVDYLLMLISNIRNIFNRYLVVYSDIYADKSTPLDPNDVTEMIGYINYQGYELIYDRNLKVFELIFSETEDFIRPLEVTGTFETVQEAYNTLQKM